MKISAIIPAYNSAGFIADAILSIQAQTHAVDEIIVVDDGSTDNTRQVINNLTGKVSYIHQQNQGPSAARNAGIKAAKGDWIAFLDADDQWTNNKIEQQLKTLKKHQRLQLIAADMAEIDINGKMITESVLAKHDLLATFAKLNGLPIPNALAALINANFIPTGTVLVKREILLAMGLFNQDIRFGEDLELWAKIASKHPITCLPEVQMLRRQHGNNATQNTEPMLADLVKVACSITRFAQDSLIEQNIDGQQLIANALANLGYWHFVSGNYAYARKIFINSLKEKPSKRAVVYTLACCLPAPLTKSLRTLKQKISA